MSLTVNSAKIEFGLQIDALNSLSGAKFLRIWNAVQSKDFLSSGSAIFDGLLVLSEKALADAANLDIDLYDLGSLDIGNGPGRDSLGLAQANATIRYMMIHNRSTSTGNLVVNSGVANGWTAWLQSGTHTLTPGSMIKGYWPAGLAVTDGSSHMLRLTASGGAVTYDLEMCSKS